MKTAKVSEKINFKTKGEKEPEMNIFIGTRTTSLWVNKRKKEKDPQPLYESFLEKNYIIRKEP